MPNTITFSVFDTEVIRGVVKTPNLRTIIDSEVALTAGRTSHVSCDRSNTKINFTAENTGAVEMLQGFKGTKYKNVLVDCDVVKNLVNSTNYGFNFSAAAMS